LLFNPRETGWKTHPIGEKVLLVAVPEESELELLLRTSKAHTHTRTESYVIGTNATGSLGIRAHGQPGE
jgi:hypothetical protein